MKKIAALIMSLCLSAVFCGCEYNSGSSSSDFKAPSYLKKYQDEDQESEEQENENEQAAPAEDSAPAPAEAPKAAPAPVTAQSTSAGETPVQPSTEQQATAAAQSVPSSAADSFRYGIWWANDGMGDSYYYFSGEGRTGSVHNQENGLGLDFSYEIYGNTAVFHMGNAEVARQAAVEWIDSSNLYLHWTDGSSEKLVFYSSVDFDNFFFYNNSELIALSLDYFENVNGWRPEYAEAGIGSGGMIDVFMYDGDQCCERYSVDRFTAAGTDLSGGSIKLD